MVNCKICNKIFKNKSIGGHMSSAHGRKIGLLHKDSDNSKMLTIDEITFRKVVNESSSFIEISKTLNLKNHYTIKKRIEDLSIDITHWVPRLKRGGHKKRTPIKEVLTKGRKINNINQLRRAMLDSNVKEYCNECGMQPQWNNKFLRLQIHHVDGDRLNNELSNLMFLCPNCHTQTDTYGVAKMYRRT